MFPCTVCDSHFIHHQVCDEAHKLPPLGDPQDLQLSNLFALAFPVLPSHSLSHYELI